jgi:MFS family permease
MIIGLATANFTLLHVLISLIGIASGIIVLIGMLGSQRFPGWTALFLITTILTSVTGFLFPIHGFTPAIGTGAISLIVLAIALIALYGRHLAGAWRWIYVVTAVIALWFNILVLIVQTFEKVALLNPHAPQVGPPFPEPQNFHFMIAQGVVLILLIVLCLAAVVRFHPAQSMTR